MSVSPPGRRPPAPGPPGRLRRAVPLLVGAVLVAAACGPAVPSPTIRPSGSAVAGSPGASPSPAGPSVPPSPTPDPATVYAAIEAQVVEIRGLEPKSPVDPQVLDEAQLKTRMETSFHEDNPAEIVRATEVLYRGMGLMAEDASLADLYIELLGSQVAGFYSPEDDELYVVSRSGGLGVSERVTYSHEFTHALQDQHFDLESFGLDQFGEGDRNGGRLALIEGDATLLMSLWLEQHLTQAEKLALVQESLDPEALAILQKMPPILRESLTFPYEEGLQLAVGLYTQGGWDAVNAAFARPPASTEQVLHPEKYDSNEAPVIVDLPDDLAVRMGNGWNRTLEDTLGEFQLAVWLRGALNRVVPANEAAAGWGGDRIAVLEGPNGAWALGLVTEWDTPGDATEFADAVAQAIPTLSAETAMGHQDGSRRVVVLFASDAPTAVQLDTILGLTGN